MSDGYESQYTICYPYLEEKGITPFVMCIAGITNGSSSGKFENQDLMNWTEITELQDHGYDIVSHSLTHPQMATGSLSPTELTQETNGSQCLIKEMTNYKPYLFCVPFGDRNATVNTYIDEYYVGCLDDYFNCPSPQNKPIFEYPIADFNYSYIPINGVIGGQNPNGNQTDNIIGNLTQHLNWLVGNGTGYVDIECWHTVFSNVSDCRGSPYSDIDETTWKACIDLIDEYVQNDSITIAQIDSVFASREMPARIKDISAEVIASILSMMMLVIALSFVTKVKF